MRYRFCLFPAWGTTHFQIRTLFNWKWFLIRTPENKIHVHTVFIFFHTKRTGSDIKKMTLQEFYFQRPRGVVGYNCQNQSGADAFHHLLQHVSRKCFWYCHVSLNRFTDSACKYHIPLPPSTGLDVVHGSNLYSDKLPLGNDTQNQIPNFSCHSWTTG